MKLDELKLCLENKTLSVLKLAALLNLSYAGLSRILKKPIKGQVYNPDSLNIEELSKWCNVQGINLENLEEEDLKSVKKKKEDLNVEVGKFYYIDDCLYELIFKTTTHVCLERNEELKSLTIKRFVKVASKVEDVKEVQ